MFDLLLISHIAAGVICLITGLAAGFARKRKGRHTGFGTVYFWCYLVVFLTTVGMSMMHWESSAYLFYIGVFSFGLALVGYLARKIRWKNWIGAHIGGMLGSYIGIVTATIVVNVEKVPVLNEVPVLIFWFLPTVIGTPIIFKTGEKYKSKRKKKLAV